MRVSDRASGAVNLLAEAARKLTFAAVSAQDLHPVTLDTMPVMLVAQRINLSSPWLPTSSRRLRNPIYCPFEREAARGTRGSCWLLTDTGLTSEPKRMTLQGYGSETATNTAGPIP